MDSFKEIKQRRISERLAIIKATEPCVYNKMVDVLEKAKYFKREPKAGGGYRYYYTEAEYKQAKGGGESKDNKESYADSDEYRVKRGEYGNAREKGDSHEEAQKKANDHWEKVKNEYSK